MKFDTELDEYLINAVQREDTESIRHLVKMGANINTRINHHGDRLLHLATARTLFHSAETLIALGQKPNIANDKGETALFAAIRENKPDMISFLAAQGANLNHEDPMGITPLIYAVCVGHEDNFRQLISLGADKNHRNRNGMTVHIFATNENMRAILDGSEAVVSPQKLIAYLHRQGKDLPPPQCLL